MLRRLFGGAPRQAPRFLLLPHGHDVDVVGESHYQSGLAKVAGGKTEDGAAKPGVIAALIREPTNQYDRNAVRVMIQGDLPHAVHVGYLPRSLAEAMSSTFKRISDLGYAGAACDAEITGGWKRGRGDEGSFGVVLNLASKKQVRKYLTALAQDPSIEPAGFGDNEESDTWDDEDSWDVPGWVEIED